MRKQRPNSVAHLPGALSVCWFVCGKFLCKWQGAFETHALTFTLAISVADCRHPADPGRKTSGVPGSQGVHSGGPQSLCGHSQYPELPLLLQKDFKWMLLIESLASINIGVCWSRLNGLGDWRWSRRYHTASSVVTRRIGWPLCATYCPSGNCWPTGVASDGSCDLGETLADVCWLEALRLQVLVSCCAWWPTTSNIKKLN